MKQSLKLKTPLFVSFLALAMLGAQVAQEAFAKPVAPVSAQSFVTSSIVTTDYKAQPWEHVLVDASMGGPNPALVVVLPYMASDGDRVRVSEVSADGAVGAGGYVAINGPSSSAVVGGTALLNTLYVIGNDGNNCTKQHASIELVWLVDGWVIVAESAKP